MRIQKNLIAFIKKRDTVQAATYLFFSLLVTVFEMVLGWLLLLRLPERILIVNTVSLCIGAVIHYLLTTRFSFRKPYSVTSAIVYAGSFAFGLFLQNAVIFALYHHLLDGLDEGFQYIFSKILSMLVALIVTYLIRAWSHKKHSKQ